MHRLQLVPARGIQLTLPRIIALRRRNGRERQRFAGAGREFRAARCKARSEVFHRKHARRCGQKRFLHGHGLRRELRDHPQ